MCEKRAWTLAKVGAEGAEERRKLARAQTLKEGIDCRRRGKGWRGRGRVNEEISKGIDMGRRASVVEEGP